jgi:hypothetical protein
VHPENERRYENEKIIPFELVWYLASVADGLGVLNEMRQVEVGP